MKLNKKTYLNVSLFLFLFTSAHAQFKLGVKGGLNLSDVVINNLIDPDKESGYTVKAGLHAGFFVIADVGTRTSLSGELLYSNKGVHAITNINLHYASVPLLVRYRLHERWIAEGGIEVSYLVTATSKYGNANATWDNKTDIGLDAGLVYNLSEKMTIGTRFNAGLSSVIRNAGVNGNGNPIRYQNRVLMLSLGYHLFSRGFRY